MRPGWISKYFDESAQCFSSLGESTEFMTVFNDIAFSVTQSIKNNGKVIFAGNGGSFADSQHLAAEFVSRLVSDRQPLPALALGTNSSITTAVGNDYGFDQVFRRELLALGTSKDTLVAISTSGNSPNILNVVPAASDIGMNVFGLTGAAGGRLAEIISCIRVPSMHTAHIQEAHIVVGHLLCFAVEELVLGSPS